MGEGLMKKLKKDFQKNFSGGRTIPAAQPGRNGPDSETISAKKKAILLTKALKEKKLKDQKKTKVRIDQAAIDHKKGKKGIVRRKRPRNEREGQPNQQQAVNAAGRSNKRGRGN